jgi:hypothetical protein
MATRSRDPVETKFTMNTLLFVLAALFAFCFVALLLKRPAAMPKAARDSDRPVCLKYSYVARDPVTGSRACCAIPGGPIDMNSAAGQARFRELSKRPV